jgi:hypothetical protein
LVVPIGVPRAKVTLQTQAHRAIGRKNHGYPLGRRLAAKDLNHGRVEKLDARSPVVAM